MMNSVVAAQLYTLRDFTKTKDIRETFARVNDLGFEAVQISALAKIDANVLRDIADKNQLEIIASHISYDLILNDINSVIKDHKTLGCRHVAIGGLPPEYRNRDGFLRFARESSEAVKPIIDAGLTFSYHNHSFELEKFGERTGFDILIEESNHDYFSFEIDVLDSAWWGEPCNFSKPLRDRMHVVFEDMAMSGAQQLFAEVGEGNLEWDLILEACKSANIEW